MSLENLQNTVFSFYYPIDNEFGKNEFNIIIDKNNDVYIQEHKNKFANLFGEFSEDDFKPFKTLREVGLFFLKLWGVNKDTSLDGQIVLVVNENNLNYTTFIYKEDEDY